MEELKKSFEEKEQFQREQFENFVKKNKDSMFLTNVKLLQMKCYHYKELLKLFANNF